MELLILGSVLMWAGLFAATGLFDGNDNSNDDNAEPNPDDPPFVHGGKGDDSLAAEDGTLSGWGGDDTLDLSGDAHGYGNQGDDTITAHDTSQAHGGLGDDRINAGGSATVWGDSGDDYITTSAYQADANALPAAYGGAGNDSIVAELGHAYGGDGNDLMIGTQNAELHGDAGNDTLSLNFGGDGSGGAGDDTLILSPLNAGPSADDSTIYAEGGEGHDIFAIDMAIPTNYATSAPTVIKDYVPGEDRLLVEVTGNPAANYIYDHASAEENSVLGYTDVTLHWHSLDPTQADLTSVIRLEGVEGFDPSSIELTSTIQPAPFGFALSPAVGEVLQHQTGGDGADAFANQSDSYITAGTGNDTVSTGTTGEVVADLGAGDDSFAAHGAGHVAFGGDGNDSYVMDAPEGIHDPLMRSGFYGGDGDDSIVIHDDGDTTNQPLGAGPAFDGGAGNDHLEAQAGTGPLTLVGGAGDDVLIGRAGQTLDTIYQGGAGADDLTLTLTAGEFASNGAASVAMDGSDHLTLNIDPALQGEVSVHYNTAGNGVEVISTEIRVGNQVVAIIKEGLPLIYDAISLEDPRLTINRV